ncbi:MAG: prolipoprotein diacylglyceryl transferase [Anaerolineales bacterium]|nr:prolipoprotein diacylglyceryl transferase [Anaerolineales bacterium]
MLALFHNFFAPPRHIVLLILAIWIGLLVAEKRAERHALSKDDLNNLVFYSLLSYILGGRIFYVLENFSAFSKSPLSVFSINLNLFDLSGALITAALALLIFIQRKKLFLWSTLDALMPFFALLIIGIELSHLAAGTAFGTPSDLPWAVELWNARRHPLQLYNLSASLLIFGWLWFKKQNQPSGILFLNLSAVTAAYLLFISAFQADQNVILNGVKSNQIIALIALIISFILFEIRLRPTKA